MIQLSKNLYREEFNCQCGKCDQEAVDSELVTVLQWITEYFSSVLATDLKIKITSGNRCKQHNAKEGGSKRSKHLFSLAADWYLYRTDSGEPVRIDMRRVYDFIDKKYAGRYGIAYYHNNGRNRIHLDTATTRRPWRKTYQ